MTRKLPILVGGYLILVICLVLVLIINGNADKLYNQLTGKTGYMYVTPTEVSYLTFSNNQTMATIENISYTAGGHREDTSTMSLVMATKSHLNTISHGFLMKSMRVGAAAARESPLHLACSRRETSRSAQTHKPMPRQMPHLCRGHHPPTTSPG